MPKSKMLNISPSLNKIVIFLPVPAICINIQPLLLLHIIRKYVLIYSPNHIPLFSFLKGMVETR